MEIRVSFAIFSFGCVFFCNIQSSPSLAELVSGKEVTMGTYLKLARRALETETPVMVQVLLWSSNSFGSILKHVFLGDLVWSML